MKDIGIYYIRDSDSIIIGFRERRRYGTSLHGKVIGHATDSYFFKAFNVGYKYHNWERGDYFGTYKNFKFDRVSDYLKFINTLDTRETEIYFKIKDKVIEYMNTYVSRKKMSDGIVLRIRQDKHVTQ